MEKVKNILHIYNSFLEQSENWSYSQIKHLSNKYNLHVCAVHKADNEFDLSMFNSYYYPYGSLIKKSWGLSNFKILDLLTKLYILLKTKWTNTPNRFFSKIISKQKIDLIHFHFADTCWKFKSLAKQHKLPFVVSFYGWDYEKLPFTKPEYNEAFKLIFKEAAQVIVEGEHGKNILIAKGCPPNKISVVPLGVEKVSITNTAKTKKTNTLKLIQIASYKEKKGFLNTIEAFSLARKKYPNIQLCIGGDSQDQKYKHQLFKLIDEHKIDDLIILGRVDFKNLNDTLDNHDVFIHPSQYANDMDCEGGAPIVILNAQSRGLPIIATTHCDIPSEVIHKSTGVLVEEKDSKALAGAIIQFYEMSEDQYNNYSKRAIEHIKTHFISEKNAGLLIPIYHSAIQRLNN